MPLCESRIQDCTVPQRLLSAGPSITTVLKNQFSTSQKHCHNERRMQMMEVTYNKHISLSHTTTQRTIRFVEAAFDLESSLSSIHSQSSLRTN